MDQPEGLSATRARKKATTSGASDPASTPSMNGAAGTDGAALTVSKQATRSSLASRVPRRDRRSKSESTASANSAEGAHPPDTRHRAVVREMGQLTWAAPGNDVGIDGVQGDGNDWRLFTGQDPAAASATWLDAIHPDDRERVEAGWQAAVSAKRFYEIDCRVRRYDGEYRWLFVREVPLLEPDGRVREWIGTATDITERKHTEESRRDSGERLAGVLHSAAVGVAVLSTATRFLHVNDTFCRIAGYSGDELRAMDCASLTHPDDLASMSEQITALLAGRIESLVLETRYRRKDSAIIWVRNSVSLTRDAAGQPAHLIALCQDITSEKATAEALRTSEARLATELVDTQRLQRISTQLIQEGDLDALYSQILDAAIALMRSDIGSMQMLYPERNELRLLAWKGFAPASAAFWEWVRAASNSSCGVALRTSQREVVSDVEACDYMVGTEDLDFFRLSGIRAVQSTPLISRTGHVVGMISTHWRSPYQPPERDLRLLDVLARQAADLIERTQAEAAAAHLAAIVASSSDAIASTTLDGIITSWNASAESMFGYTAQEVIGQSALVLVPPDRRSEEEEILARLSAGESVEHYETVRVTKHGRRLDVSLTTSPVRDSAGAIVGASIIIRDSTERKRAEEALLKSEARQSFLLALGDQLRPLMHPRQVKRVACEMLGAYLGVSRAAYGEIGHASDGFLLLENGWTDGTIPELSGQFPFSALPSAAYYLAKGVDVTLDDCLTDPRCAEPDVQAFIQQYDIRSGDTAMIMKDGRLAGLLLVQSKSPRHWTGEDHSLLREVAERTWTAVERARTEAALHVSERALQDANQRKDEFLSIASHELRTPLTSITVNVQVARKQLAALSNITHALDVEPGKVIGTNGNESLTSVTHRLERTELLLERVDRQMARLDRLVGDLLDVSRIQAGKLELRPVSCDLLTIVGEAIAEQQAAWSERSIVLRLPRSASVPILADADRIGQVVTNLLTNALKYSSDDAEVAVSIRVQDDRVRVAVGDSGPGLTREQQAHLFERFYRVPGIEQTGGSGVGLGLGLHICKTIVERHTGQVGVESVPGKGSTFWFTLPLTHADGREYVASGQGAT